jgi:cyclase
MKQIVILYLAIIGFSCLSFGDSTIAPAETPVALSQINNHLYLITCTGGSEFDLPLFGTNLIASVGSDGLLLVDAGFESTGEFLRDTLKALWDDKCITIINTHYHGDHAAANRFFRDQAIIMAHRTVLESMSGNYYHLPGTPNPNQPEIGFDDSLVLRFNGEDIRILHIPAAHTGGDVCVYFINSKIAAVGDLIFPDEIPYIDLLGGGTVDGYLASIRYLIDKFPDDAKFVAAHGRDYDKEDLRKYEKMLTGTVGLVKVAAARGETDSSMIRQNLLADYVSWKGRFPTTTLEAWIRTIYRETIHKTGAWPAICEPMTRILAAGNVDDAILEYHNLKARKPEAYDFGEDNLNMLGYQLLARNRVDDALAIFKLNCEQFPNSGNVYDSYGEAFLIKGDTAQSIQNYEKSLMLDPANKHAAEVLNKIRPSK